MRKYLAILLLGVTISGATYTTAEAQTPWKSETLIVRNGAGAIKAADTLTNTDTNYVGHRVTQPHDIVMEVNYTKLSGFGRGTAKLKGSSDSTNGPWYTVRGEVTTCSTCVDSVYTITNTASQQARWQFSNAKFLYYKVFNYTDTTQTMKATGVIRYAH